MDEVRKLLLCLLVGLLVYVGQQGDLPLPGPGPTPDVTEPTKPPTTVQRPSLVAYVYEGMEMEVPLHVHPAREQLEATGLEVRVIDVDAKTGTGQVPQHLAAAIAAARKHGLPALVIQHGTDARPMTLPATAAEIVAAAGVKP